MAVMTGFISAGAFLISASMRRIFSCALLPWMVPSRAFFLPTALMASA